MIKILRNQIIMSVKDSSYIRCVFYTFFSAIMIVMMTWTLGNAMPDFLGEALSKMNEQGNINLGFIVFESLEQIEAMNAENMLKLAYSSPFIAIIIGVFAVEAYSKNAVDGYFAFLLSKRVTKWNVYLSRVFSSYILAIALYILYGLICYSAAVVAFGKYAIGNWVPIVTTLFVQIFVLLGLASFYTLCICVFKKTISTVVFVILACIGTPAVASFIASLSEADIIRYYWIGTCSTYFGNESIKGISVVGIAILYFFVSMCIGGTVFSKRDLY